MTTENKETHDLKLTVNVRATGGLHAAKAVLEAYGKDIANASCEVPGIGQVTLDAETVHVSEKKPKRKDDKVLKTSYPKGHTLNNTPAGSKEAKLG
jgi:hypothetical protein